MHMFQDLMLPDSIQVSLCKDGILIMQMKAGGIFENMQKDSSCFEGWALALKSGDYGVKSIKLEFPAPVIEICTKLQLQHYRRFLFRLIKFQSLFTWFFLDINPYEELKELRVDLTQKQLVTNEPNENRPTRFPIDKPLIEFTEDELENIILNKPEIAGRLKEVARIDILDRQLPVGLFNNYKSNPSMLFPGKKSAIDLWGFNSTSKDFAIFELKVEDNKKVGVISEMLFYVFFIEEIRKGRFQNEWLVKKIGHISKINVYILSPSFHRIVDNNIFALLNDAWAKSNSDISIAAIRINQDFTFEKI